jgi:hypothetical protein
VCEEEVSSGCGFDRLVAVEFGTVVDGDGTGATSSVVDEVDGASVGGLDGPGPELADQDVSGLSVDERQ